MALASILVVDGDSDVRKQIASSLRELGHDVAESESAVAALRAVERTRPDLMVCDCALPDLAGVELLSDVRRSGEYRAMRVLMTSANGRAEDAVAALESGADDFVGKPLHMPEFLARVKACLRRPANFAHADVCTAGGITVDDIGHRVLVDGSSISLAPREYRLLHFLLTNQDRVFSRKQLLVHVWDRDTLVGPRTVDVHVRRLRSLLEPHGYDRYLQTVRGSGYRFSLHD
ncbi:MAG TPA: winged helix-turn-helix domain-containing protein [Woeseiaceae bacterium]|nr:winged helix-turn-helix domain-containing protein [Woeseiaceae bacterium]